MDGFSPIRGKCQFWREAAHIDDTWDTRVLKEDKRVICSCFIDGDMWVTPKKETPSDCPKRYQCRYYIKSG